MRVKPGVAQLPLGVGFKLALRICIHIPHLTK